MNLYLITQDERTNYDTYDAAVVAARSAHAARRVHPAEYAPGMKSWHADNSWASKPENVTTKLLGLARAGTKEGVICASFNAG